MRRRATGIHRTIPAMIVTLACAGSVAGCGASTGNTSSPAAPTVGLQGTSWQLVEFRSSDDAIGIVRPDDPTKYTMTLEDENRVAMQLNCNRATGTWKATAADSDSGTFAFSQLAMTRALCLPPSLDTQISQHADYVRTYLLRDGRLHLDLMADGGTYVWEPRPTGR